MSEAPPRASRDTFLDCEVVVTRSGEPAMRDKLSGELMHPVVGPRVEAEHYVRSAHLSERLSRHHLRHDSRDASLCVFDVGLGAGSNALAALSCAWAQPPGASKLVVISFDRSLAAFALASAPEHAEAFGRIGIAAQAAASLLEHGIYEDPHVRWELRHGDLFDTLASVARESADAVLWDPFSPAQNPELWCLRAFALLHRACRAHASVHTYSAATAVRSALLLAGFFVAETTPLPALATKPASLERRPGTCATRAHEDLACYGAPLGPRFLERLERSSSAFAADAPRDALERLREHPQFRSPL